MVAGNTRNPWAFPGPAILLDEAYLSACGGGREVEAVFAATQGIPLGIPDWEPESDPEADYLYVEELPEVPGLEMTKVSLDLQRL